MKDDFGSFLDDEPERGQRWVPVQGRVREGQLGSSGVSTVGAADGLRQRAEWVCGGQHVLQRGQGVEQPAPGDGLHVGGEGQGESRTPGFLAS